MGAGSNQVTRSYGYDDTHGGRLTLVQGQFADAGSTLFQKDSYGYDDDGNVTSIKEGANTGTGSTAQTQCFAYDPLARLTEAWTTGAPCSTNGTPNPDLTVGAEGYQRHYTYDVLNRMKTNVDPNGASITYSYGVTGHVHAPAQTTSTTAGVTTTQPYTYNAEGDTATRTVGSTNYTLTTGAEHTLDLVTNTSDSSTTRSIYDASGTRVVRQVTNGSGTTSTFYAGANEITRSPSGTVTAKRYYSSGGASIAMRDNDGTLTWLLNDTQNSASIAIQNGTTTVQRQRYLPYGAPRTPGTPALPTDKAFLGHIQDTSDGLLDDGARAYDPILGKFTSPDPLVDTANPLTYDAYGYAADNPTTYSDPSGLSHLDPYGHTEGPVSAPGKPPTAPAHRAPWHRPYEVHHGRPKGHVLPKSRPKWCGPYRCDAPVEKPHDSGFLEFLKGFGGYYSNLASSIRHPSWVWDDADDRAMAWLLHPGDTAKKTFLGLAGWNSEVCKKSTAGCFGGIVANALLLGAPKGVSALRGGDEAAAATLSAAEGAGGAGDHIVLGLRDYGLEETAAKVGGRTLLNDPEWESTLARSIGDPSTRFTVSLDGLSGSSTYSRVMSAVQNGATPLGSATNWELAQLYQAGRLGDVSFVSGGEAVANPWAP